MVEAARQGHPAAQNNLGVLYRDGERWKRTMEAGGGFNDQ